MGLAAAKRRSKLSHDPNNTAWSRSTTSFGHKIMSQQGWKPGDYLGAQDASHADHYTAANASHVRVLLREENLGLGAKLGGTNAETFGLSLFSGVLGRLNGKSDQEVQKQQDALRDAELRTYQAQKFGFLNFVRGGLLVGDRMEEFPKSTPMNGTTTEDIDSRKRKATEAAHETSEVREKKRSKREAKQEESVKQEDSTEKDKKKSKHESGTKRRKKNQSDNKAMNASEYSRPGEADSDTVSPADTGVQIDVDRRSTSKKAKCATKEEQRARRKERERRKADLRVVAAGSPLLSEALKTEKQVRRAEREKRKRENHQEDPKIVSLRSKSPQEQSTGNGQSAQQPATPWAGSRHAVRQRYIQQKRMASMSTQAMNEIFMLKAGA